MGRKKNPESVQMTVMSIKMTEGFKAWMKEIADNQRLSDVQLVEMALVEYAEKRGLPAAPRRLEGR